MRLIPYLNIARGLSTAGLFIAGTVAGAVGAPLIKKEARNTVVNLLGNMITTGQKLKTTVHRQSNRWSNIVEEARTRREDKRKMELKMQEVDNTTGEPNSRIKKSGIQFGVASDLN